MQSHIRAREFPTLFAHAHGFLRSAAGAGTSSLAVAAAAKRSGSSHRSPAPGSYWSHRARRSGPCRRHSAWLKVERAR